MTYDCPSGRCASLQYTVWKQRPAPSPCDSPSMLSTRNAVQGTGKSVEAGDRLAGKCGIRVQGRQKVR